MSIPFCVHKCVFYLFANLSDLQWYIRRLYAAFGGEISTHGFVISPHAVWPFQREGLQCAASVLEAVVQPEGSRGCVASREKEIPWRPVRDGGFGRLHLPAAGLP